MMALIPVSRGCEFQPSFVKILQHLVWGAGYWAVVQSTLKLSGAEIWERLMPCLDPHSSADAAAHHTASLSGSAAPDAVDHATAAEGSDGEGARR